MDLEQAQFLRKCALESLDKLLAETFTDREFKIRYRSLEPLKKEFLCTQKTIEKLLIKAKTFDPKEQATIRSDFEEKYFKVQTIYADRFPPRDESCFNSTALGEQRQTDNKPNLRLPKISLPEFSGDYTAWGNFRDLYQTLIHNNTSLNNIEKFQYLLLSLREEPKRLIQSIPINESQYTLAWDCLVKRYDNPRCISSKHVEALLDLSHINKNTTAQQIQHFTTVITEHVGALKNMGIAVDGWDYLLFHIIQRKLDGNIRQQFEDKLDDPRVIPKLGQLMTFLEKFSYTLENSQARSQTYTHENKSQTKTGTALNSKQPSSVPTRALMTMPVPNACAFCREQSHNISQCSEFLHLNPVERYGRIKEKKICINCLSPLHTFAKCKSMSKCKICNKKHNTLLHFDTVEFNMNSACIDASVSPPQGDSPPPPTAPRRRATEAVTPLAHPTPLSAPLAAPASSGSTDADAAFAPSPVRTPNVLSLLNSHRATGVLYFTARVKVTNPETGVRCDARAVIDSAAEATFISEDLVQTLGLSRRRACIPVNGLGTTEVNRTRGCVSYVLEPHFESTTKICMDAWVVPKICDDLPATRVPPASFWPHVQNLALADPAFNIPQEVDLLIGIDYIPYIFLENCVSSPPGTPFAMNSTLGYLLMGYINTEPTKGLNQPPTCLLTLRISLDESIRKFWEVEEIPTRKALSPEDQRCEDHFRASHAREVTGRYVVRLPFTEEPPTPLGNSRNAALRRFAHLERRLSKDVDLATEYHACLQDYLDEGHMEVAPQTAHPESQCYYLPHHCVIKQDSLTTKLRTVFDASMKSESGKSLNDILLTGPTLQRDILAVISNFRLHQVAFTADIKQMYRQIALHPDDRDWHRLLWRDNGGRGVLREFRLCTVTFGVSSSPYLALRTLQQLADDDGGRYPHAARVLRHDVFVDDVVSGADSVEAALVVQRELIDLCAGGGFPLRKWTSNAPELLSDLSDDAKISCLSFDDDRDAKVKVLGLEWNPQKDCFSYRVQPSTAQTFTKRIILSEISRIFDPAGYLSPAVILVKILIQNLWTLGVGWDEPLPDNVSDRFGRFLAEAPKLAEIQIPRYILSPLMVELQLHGFCDASQSAYSCVIYLRTQKSDGSVDVKLVMAKSKVAPLKSLSIPRLELCGALLLSRLVDYVRTTYAHKITFDKLFAWCDSSVVLAWLRSSPHTWKTFVANRVTEIQDKIPPEHWKHISTENNPADCASRGLYPLELADHHLWWAGCKWLTLPEPEWPVSKHESVTSLPADASTAVSEKRTQVMSIFTSPSNEFLEELINKYSSLQKLLRVTAYVFRFISNCRTQTQSKGFLTLETLNHALTFWTQYVQRTFFAKDIDNIKNNKVCSVSMQRLNPFLDSKGLVRAGGRIKHSDISFEAKHPIVLPKRSHLTILIIDDTHVRYLHPGVQTLQAIIRQRYWIFSARSIIRERVHRCMTCYRHKPCFTQPRMSDLPAYRVKQLRAFAKVGIDYAGPYLLKANKFRNSKSYKAYLCLFICLCTKAVHLELVTDLTSEAFIAALRRFAGRRAAPSDIFSDNGTCFVGANKKLKEWYALLRSADTQGTITDTCAGMGITWHFNPSSAPHFGGIWESNIKSAKHYITRAIGLHTLTFEEFSTLLCQVEAVLNSRPLYALSNDANDEEALTPGHFLVGQALTAPPDIDTTHDNINAHSRWRLIQRCVGQFWKQWHINYLNTLQSRNKWAKPSSINISVGQLVVVKDDTSPPLAWKLGRVVCTHPGDDGIVRVVSVRTQGKIFKRPVVKLAPLPSAPDSNAPYCEIRN